MSEISDRKPTLEEPTTPQVESTDPAYLKWREEKIRGALADDIAHPELRISLEAIKAWFGIVD